jgi:type 1 glutamine amidotransferase
MKLPAFAFAISALILGTFVTSAPAADQKPFRILLTYGGHAFEQKEFYAMWDALPGIQYTKCELPRQADMLKPGLEKNFDVIVMYDMAKDWTPAQEKSFVELIRSGMPLVCLHHNLCSRDDSPAFHQIIGGQYVHKPTVIDGKQYAPCTYKHGQHLEVKIADKNHPITHGLSDFTIEDEAYHGFWVSPNVHVLLTVEHPLCNHDVCWTTEFGKARVFYLMFGHDHTAWQNPNYPVLLRRGIQWAVGGTAVAMETK